MIESRDPGRTPENISLFSADGKMVFDKTVEPGQRQLKISTENMADGAYYLQIGYSDGVVRKQVIVMH